MSKERYMHCQVDRHKICLAMARIERHNSSRVFEHMYSGQAQQQACLLWNRWQQQLQRIDVLSHPCIYLAGVTGSRLKESQGCFQEAKLPLE